MSYFIPGKVLTTISGYKSRSLSLVSSAGIESNVLLELLSAITTQSVFPDFP